MASNSKYEVLLDDPVWENRVFKNKHECINHWLKRKHSHGRCGRRTLNEYSRTTHRFFHEWYPETHPADVTVGDIEEYVMDLHDRGVGQNTKRKYVENLSSFYTWALFRPSYPDITGNPAKVVLEEIPKRKRARPETATWENGKRIIWHMPDLRNKTIVVLLAKTGARVQEVLDIQVEDVDWDNGFVRLRDRKGGIETKNPLDQETLTVMRRLRAVERIESGFLFQKAGGGPIRRERVRQKVREAAVRAGVMGEVDEKRWHYKFTPHYYRTIFTSLMRNSEPRMKEHWLAFLRGDDDETIRDLYTKIPHEKVRKRYLEIMKPLDV